MEFWLKLALEKVGVGERSWGSGGWRYGQGELGLELGLGRVRGDWAWHGPSSRSGFNPGLDSADEEDLKKRSVKVLVGWLLGDATHEHSPVSVCVGIDVGIELRWE